MLESNGFFVYFALIFFGRITFFFAAFSAFFFPVPSLSVFPSLLTRSRGGPGHGTLRWTRTSEQTGKALRSQGHHCARVM